MSPAARLAQATLEDPVCHGCGGEATKLICKEKVFSCATCEPVIRYLNETHFIYPRSL